MVYDASMPRPARMTDERRERLGRLLGKANLTPLERGELAALGRQGSQAEQEQVHAKLSRGGGVTTRQVGQAIAAAVAKAMDDGGPDMHQALEGLERWQDHQRQTRELEDLIGRWAAHDLEAGRAQRQLLVDHQAAVDAAVETGQPVPEAPVQPVVVRSRTSELQQARTQLIEQGRRPMDELRPLVAQRAQAREAELLAEVRRTAVQDLELLRAEAEELAGTLRAVLLDGHTYRADVAVGELVECALEPGSSVLFLPERGPFIHVERPSEVPAGRVLLDTDRGPGRDQVLARYRRVQGQQRSQTVSHRLDG
jgi:hypothetical protein